MKHSNHCGLVTLTFETNFVVNLFINQTNVEFVHACHQGVLLCFLFTQH